MEDNIKHNIQRVASSLQSAAEIISSATFYTNDMPVIEIPHINCADAADAVVDSIARGNSALGSLAAAEGKIVSSAAHNDAPLDDLIAVNDSVNNVVDRMSELACMFAAKLRYVLGRG
ncbi:MAG: hypothetical protein LBS72_04810 [Oscillospiraceae bacterium]|jgi:hypothetical protein|nr:hypothetical protein [Oscillospiraceae bacterium]